MTCHIYLGYIDKVMINLEQVINTLHYAGMIETLGFTLSEGIPNKGNNCFYMKDDRLHYYYIVDEKR